MSNLRSVQRIATTARSRSNSLFKYPLDSSPPLTARPYESGPSNPDSLRSQRQSFHHICSASDSAINQNLNLVENLRTEL